MQDRLKAIKKQYGSRELGKVTVDMTIGGMRGITVTRPWQCSMRRDLAGPAPPHS